MRNLKKFLALVLAMMMAFSLMVTVNAADDSKFTDGVNDSFAEAVEVLNGMGVFKGYEDGTFKPQTNISRAEVAAIVYRLATGDAEGKQAHLYASGADKFADVAADHWGRGEIGYCANNLLVLGYSDTRFGPKDNVTGVQALAMILRAVGYGKNNEFKGPGWETNVYGRARSEKLLVNVDKTSYASNLSQPATRELVAELLFRAANIPQVTWTMLGDYNKTDAVLGTGRDNPSLGLDNFGLTEYNGHVIANQATGENGTIMDGGIYPVDATGNVTDEYGNIIYEKIADSSIVKKYDEDGNVNADWNTAVADTTNTTYRPLKGPAGTSYVANTNYAYGNGNTKFNYGTGLDLFGHSATVWYDSRNSSSKGYATYAVIDQATHVATVYAEDGVLAIASPNGTNDKLAVAAKAAGFSVQPDTSKLNPSKAHYSDRYCQLGGLEDSIATTGKVSPVNMYALVSNNPSKTVDVVIALSAEVAKITQKNTTAATPHLILGSSTGNTSTFGNGTTAGTINLDQLTPGTKEEQKKVGALVTAYEVVGTSKTLSDAKSIAAKGDEDAMYQLDPMKTESKTVASYKTAATALDSKNPHAVEVNFTDGTTMKLSGITRGDNTNSEIISAALPVVDALAANTTYTVYVDEVGRFISLTTGSNYEFLYGTFADYAIGGLGTGTIEYNMVGVDWNGEIKANNPIKSYDHDGDGTSVLISGAEYNKITATAKDQGSASGNEIKDGYNTGYRYNAANGDLTTDIDDATKMATGTKWKISASDAQNGFVKVNNSSDGTNGSDYLLTKDTNFIIVSGAGTATLKVEKLTGLVAFLNAATTAEISFTTGKANVNGEEVIFRTEDQKFGTINTDKNGVITDIILSEGNVIRYSTENLYFNFDKTQETGLVLPGEASVKQYELWNNGEVGYYFVDTTETTGDNVPDDAMTFYTLAKLREVNGVPVYKAVRASENSGKGGLVGQGYASDSATYEYITVSNLNTGLFKDTTTTAGKVFNIANAKVCDVDWKETTGESALRSEINDTLKLNNAVSVKQIDGSTKQYTISVAIVYSGVEVSCIYVTNVA